MIIARYRKDYLGEFVITETRLVNGVKQEQREWIDNPITNNHISGRAAIIGSRMDERKFQHQRLQRHRGGLMGRKRLQTYATGDIWTDMRLDFYVSVESSNLEKIIEEQYNAHTTVYTTTAKCIQFPGNFYPVPYLPQIDQLAMAIYLAAFDGHEEIFLLGCNKDLPKSSIAVFEDIQQIMQAYRGTQFIGVGPPSSFVDSWLDLPNFSTMNLRDWISYCDI